MSTGREEQRTLHWESAHVISVPVEKIWSCGEICPHDRWSGGVILHMTDCHVEKILHMGNVKKICGKCGEIMWCFVAFYVILLQNHFIVIYAVLSRNMFPRDSRAFAWRNFF